jgi:hypothetical protein
MKQRIVKKDGMYFVTVPGQASRKVFLSPAGKTLKEARARLRADAAELRKTTWRMFKDYCRPVDEGAVWKAIAGFRVADTEAFCAQQKLVVHTDYPDTFLRMTDGLANALRRCGFTFEVMSTDDLRGGALSKYDAVIFPGGFGYHPDRRLAGQIRDFVRQGGGFLGLCAGAFFALRSEGRPTYSRLGLLDATCCYFRESGLCHVVLNAQDHVAQGVGSSTRAPATPLSHRAARTERKVHVSMLRGNGPLIIPGPKAVVVGSFDSTAGYAAIVRGEYGRGRAIIFSPHPEVSAETVRLSSVADAIECLKVLKNGVLYCARPQRAAR